MTLTTIPEVRYTLSHQPFSRLRKGKVMFGMERLNDADPYTPFFRLWTYMQVIVLCTVILTGVLKVVIYAYFRERMSKLEELVTRNQELLMLVKEWCKLGPDVSRGTKEVLEAEKNVSTKIDEVHVKVDGIPEKIIDKLNEHADSGKFQVVKPTIPLV